MHQLTPLLRGPTSRFRSLGSISIAMAKTITLTDQEAALRQLLLDTADYIGTLEGCTKPQLRITGGWVRDKLLGSQSMDVDIGIDTMTGFKFGTLMKQYLAQPETKAKYKQGILGSLAKIEANPEKSKHLETVTTKILGLEIDLVNLRKETYVESSRNPTMEFGTPEEDALRRDATVNALFYNLSTSEVEDFTGRGFQDMERKVMKTPLAPLQTFKDDPLRVLRSIRFASRLGYQLAAEDEVAISNSSIKEALRLKVSRERVGTEITKMLKGPNPHAALSVIDRLGLYNEVFTNPVDAECNVVETDHWGRAYNHLLKIANARSAEPDGTSPPKKVARVLLRNSDDTFLAWMLACFVPWAKVSPKLPKKPTSKKQPSPASLAAREGLKADNKVCKVVDDAVCHLQEIVTLKGAVNNDPQPTTTGAKRKQGMTSRESQGQAIRGWGSHWRSSVMFALLIEISDTGTEADSERVLDGYVAWLAGLQALDLLDVDQLKPIVNGNDLTQALGTKKAGPWMKKALDIAMEWQLRNPEETDPAGGIAEVLERKKELCIS